MKYITLIILGIGFIMHVSCSKRDDHYYNYINTQPNYQGTVYSYLTHQRGTFDSLVLALERLPALKERLNDPTQETTFFSIDNRSFALALDNLNKARKDNSLANLSIESIPYQCLDSLMHRYVFTQKLLLQNFSSNVDGMGLLSANYNYPMHGTYRALSASGFQSGGPRQLEFSDTNRSIFVRYWSTTNTVAVDLNTSNGIVHTLSPRHEFGFGKLTELLYN